MQITRTICYQDIQTHSNQTKKILKKYLDIFWDVFHVPFDSSKVDPKAPSLRVSSQDGTESVLDDAWRFGETWRNWSTTKPKAQGPRPKAQSPKHSKVSAQLPDSEESAPLFSTAKSNNIQKYTKILIVSKAPSEKTNPVRHEATMSNVQKSRVNQSLVIWVFITLHQTSSDFMGLLSRLCLANSGNGKVMLLVSWRTSCMRFAKSFRGKFCFASVPNGLQFCQQRTLLARPIMDCNRDGDPAIPQPNMNWYCE